MKLISGECKEASDSESNYEIDGDSDEEDALGKIDKTDGLPIVCLICEKDFKDPIQTLCNHYFCETCALKNYINDSKCFVCGAETKGSFNIATSLLNKLKN